MRSLGARAVLDFAGRNGPLLLFTGVLIGLLVPALADAARPLLGVAVFVFTLGAFLKVELVDVRREFAKPASVLGMLAWTTFGVPAAAFGLVRVLEPTPAIAEGIILCMLAPPVGSAAAIAAMLGLSAPLALLATVAATVCCPFYLPPLSAWLAGTHIQLDPAAMTLRLLIIVGGACAVATLLRRFAGSFVKKNPHAMTGVAVLGLILVAIGAMRGMQSYFLAHSAEVVVNLAIAFGANAAFQALGALLFIRAGRWRALTVGLVSGNRNITLIWAAAGASIADQPQIELFLAMSVFPIFMLPAIQRRLFMATRRPLLPQSVTTLRSDAPRPAGDALAPWSRP